MPFLSECPRGLGTLCVRHNERATEDVSVFFKCSKVCAMRTVQTVAVDFLSRLAMRTRLNSQSEICYSFFYNWRHRIYSAENSQLQKQMRSGGSRRRCTTKLSKTNYKKY